MAPRTSRAGCIAWRGARCRGCCGRPTPSTSWSTHWPSSLCSTRWVRPPVPGGPPTGPGKPPLLVLGRRCPLTALCPQYEQTLPVLAEPDPRQELRAQIRKNITETLVSLRVNTVDDIQQVAAALAQCTVGQTSPAAAWPLHAPRAPFPAKPARLCAPQGGPWGSGHVEHAVLPRACGPHPVARESAARLGWAPS